MEVHHHAHSQRKTWVHYFWEFLMLFLAVFCGFLAENLRENVVEQHRAKEYAKGLMNDLKNDIKELKTAIVWTNFLAASLDSSISIILKHPGQTKLPGTFYYYGRFSASTYTIDWSSSTLTQLIQSGNLRYFKNKDFVKQVNAYYALEGSIASQNQRDNEQRWMALELRNKIFTGSLYNAFKSLSLSADAVVSNRSKEIDSLIAISLPIQPGAEKLLDTYVNHLNDRKSRVLTVSNTYYNKAIKIAEELISALNKEYHLE